MKGGAIGGAELFESPVQFSDSLAVDLMMTGTIAGFQVPENIILREITAFDLSQQNGTDRDIVDEYSVFIRDEAVSVSGSDAHQGAAFQWNSGAVDKMRSTPTRDPENLGEIVPMHPEGTRPIQEARPRPANTRPSSKGRLSASHAL